MNLWISAGHVGLTLWLSQSLAVDAAEIKVIASTGVASVVTELGRQFEATTGHTVQTDFAVIAVSKRKIDAGATFDIAILSPAVIDELVALGKIVADTRVSFGRTGIGVAVRKDTPRQDIGSGEAFKKMMLAAKSVGHSNLTASLNTTRVSCEAVRATGAPRQHPGDRDDQYAMHGGDRVWDMTLRPDRGRRGVGNLREG